MGGRLIVQSLNAFAEKLDVAIFVPPKCGGETVRWWVRDICRKLNCGRSSPLMWNRNIFKSIECDRWIGVMRHPVDRFVSLFNTRCKKIEEVIGERIREPMDLLSEELWNRWVWPHVPSLLAADDFENSRRSWGGVLDIARHLLPQTFYVGGTEVFKASRASNLKQKKTEIVGINELETKVGRFLYDAAGLEFVYAKRNSTHEYQNRRSLTKSAVAQDASIMNALLYYYKTDFDRWDAAVTKK